LIDSRSNIPETSIPPNRNRDQVVRRRLPRLREYRIRPGKTIRSEGKPRFRPDFNFRVGCLLAGASAR